MKLATIFNAISKMYVLETQKLQDFKSASKNEHYCQIDSTAFSHAKRKKNFACGGLNRAI